MRVVIDGTPAINDIRAIQRYAWNLIRELAEIDSENKFSVIYLGGGRGKTGPTIENPNFNSIASSIPGKLLKLSWKMSSFPDISFWAKKDFDLAHFPGGAAYIPVKSGVVLTTMHGFGRQKLSNFFADEPGYSELMKLLGATVARSNHFIAVSETNKAELSALWNVRPENITAIPLGVSSEFKEYEISLKAKAEILRRYALPDKKYILYVGALEPHKNIGNIISSYAILNEKLRREFNLVLIGGKTPYCQNYYRQAQELGISEQVRFVDYIQPGSIDLAYFYNLAELFVFPSFYEGWASPPLEAMRCGAPTLVSNIPSLRESTGETARYCDPNSTEDIANKITEILQDPAKYEKLRRDGLRFSSEYTWRKCAEKTMALYKKLLSKI